MYTSDAINIINEILNNPKTLSDALLKDNAFTQKEILDFKSVISIMLDYSGASLQAKITRHCKECNKKRTVTKQALSKALSQIDESPFAKIFVALIDYIYKGKHLLKTFNNYLLFAVDGSYFNIPKTFKNMMFFNIGSKATKLKMGGSMIYDVLNNVPMAFKISKNFMNERKEFIEQLNDLEEAYSHVLANAIFAVDMGYPSLELIIEFYKRKIKFVMRASCAFLKEINEAPLGDNIVTLRNGLKIRVLKFITDKNELITLCTNLFDLTEDELKEVYRLRWIVETSFNTAKNKLFVDKNQGKTVNFLHQSYWATMVKMVFLGIGQNECDKNIENEEKQNTLYGFSDEKIYEYKTNTQILIKTFEAFYILSGVGKKCFNSIFDLSMALEEAVKRKIKKKITASINIIERMFDYNVWREANVES